MICLRQKVFFLDANGNAITGDQLKAQKAAAGGSLKDNLAKMKVDQAAAANAKAAQRAAERTALKANAPAVANVAKAANAKGYNAGVKAGQASATVNKGTIMNTWNKMGTAGKVGTAVAGAAIGGLALAGAKNLLSKKKKEE